MSTKTTPGAHVHASGSLIYLKGRVGFTGTSSSPSSIKLILRGRFFGTSVPSELVLVVGKARATAPEEVVFVLKCSMLRLL